MKKYDIKPRYFVFVLAAIGILFAAIGGYLHYSTLRKSAIERLHRDASEHVSVIGNHIDSHLTLSIDMVKALAGRKELKQPLVRREAVSLAEANAILDHFRDTMHVNVCYLIDRSGNTLASSNRDTINSFVGNNFGFLPYFQQAMLGIPAIYMALGGISKKRGIYLSHPVYGNGNEGPFGVAVIKVSFELIKDDFKKPLDGILMITDPHGVVFASSREVWLYHVLWKVSSETLSNIAKTKQFGKGPWNWTGVKLMGKDLAVDKLGNEYHVHWKEIANYPGWQLIYLHDYYKVLQRITAPQLRTFGGLSFFK